MKLTLKIWRQASAQAKGKFETYQQSDFDPAMSVPEMLDHLNRHLIKSGEDPIAFESDCREGDTLWLEPFRVGAFPVKKDLMIDRSALDRIIQSGGYISVDTGPAVEANSQLISHETAESAFDSAACIGCGACAAVCPNASASLFTGAKVSHLAKLPQGQVEASKRVINMVQAMDAEGFGACSLVGACEAICPQGISLANIAQMNGEFRQAMFE